MVFERCTLSILINKDAHITRIYQHLLLYCCVKVQLKNKYNIYIYLKGAHVGFLSHLEIRLLKLLSLLFSTIETIFGRLLSVLEVGHPVFLISHGPFHGVIKSRIFTPDERFSLHRPYILGQGLVTDKRSVGHFRGKNTAYRLFCST